MFFSCNLKKLVCISFFICWQLVVAQHPISVQLTQKDGLPDIEFYDVIEDKKGFIWFTCDKGLYRYNGKEFKNFSHPEKRGLSMFGLQFDAQNRLWCTNVTGQFFYVEDNKLHLFLDMSKELKQDERLYEFAIFNNNLIILGINVLIAKNIENNKVKFIVNNKEYNFLYANSIIRNDTLFSLQFKNSLKVNYIEKNSDLELKLLASRDLINKNNINGVLYEFNNEIYFQENNGAASLTRAVLEKNKLVLLKDLPLKEIKRINRIAVLDNKQWMLTEKGVEVFTQKNAKETPKRVHYYFPKKNVTEVIKDKQNNYWFTTLRNGVFVMPNINVNTYQLQQDIGNVTTIKKIEKTHIYFGTTLGWLGIYDIQKKETKYIKLKTSSKIRHIVYNKKLKDIYVVSDGINGSFIIDAISQKVTQQPEKEKSFAGVKGIIILKNQQLFTSSISNSFIYNVSKGKIDSKTYISNKNKRNYNTLYDASKEDIYITYVDDLIVYDKNLDAKKIRYKNKPIFARSITQTEDGIVWVSTFKDGILAVKDYKVIRTYTTKNGLLSNQTGYVMADGNDVWITSENGLQLLNTATNTFKNLTSKDGIESFNINGIEIIDNTIWFGSNLGLFSFDKTKVFKERKVIAPYFTSVTIADSTYAIKPFYKVAPNKNRIAINFNTNEFNSAQNTLYQYRLLGGQANSWQFVTKGVNEVVFNRVEQGKYTFQLRTIDGKKTSKIAEITFQVKGVFYKQWWFVLLWVILIVAGMVYYFNKRLKIQEEKRNQELEKQQNELEKTLLKLENLRSQMNPHFVFNALNSIQDYIINNEKDLAGDYLGKFSDLIRMYLDQSSQKEILLSEEIDTLERYLELEKLRFEDKLVYKIEIKQEVDSNEITIPTMLIQPYIENALKHGLLHKRTTGHLIVKFSLNFDENYLIVRIIDDGIGRKKSEEIKAKQFIKHKSFATKATQDRLELLNFNRKNKIKVVTTDVNTNTKLGNIGTKVTIQIPLK